MRRNNLIEMKIQCPKCSADVDVPYTMEELLSGNKLEFTCEKCGKRFKKVTADDAKRQAVEFAKNAFNKYGNN